jgi:hypothetical protein
VVYAKQPFGGPQQVLDYLGRYTHRVALSNNRLVSVSDTEVRFRYKDYAHGNARKVLALQPAEFIRRFLLHVLPTGFMRIRHYGLIANRAKRTKLAAARAALDHPPAAQPRQPESVEAFWNGKPQWSGSMTVNLPEKKKFGPDGKELRSDWEGIAPGQSRHNIFTLEVRGKSVVELAKGFFKRSLEEGKIQDILPWG